MANTPFGLDEGGWEMRKMQLSMKLRLRWGTSEVYFEAMLTSLQSLRRSMVSYCPIDWLEYRILNYDNIIVVVSGCSQP